MCHVSHVTCHISPVNCRMPPTPTATALNPPPANSPTHKCFKCWWLALPEKKKITKPLKNSTFNHGLHEGPSYTVLNIIKDLLTQFES